MKKQQSLGTKIPVSASVPPKTIQPPTNVQKIPRTTTKRPPTKLPSTSNNNLNNTITGTLDLTNENVGTLSLDTTVYKPPEMTDSEIIEVEQLRKEVTNLNEKLETLKQKRKEDYDKLREYEHLKNQAETFQLFKKEMTSVHTALKKENEELKKELKESMPVMEGNNDVSHLMEQIEMVSLDKEMAEEKAELLLVEKESLQSKIQDLETELALMKNAVEKGKFVGIDGDEQQNERYRDAILRLRDVVSRANDEIEIYKKELAETQTERDELIEISSKLEKELEESKQSLAAFVEQLKHQLHEWDNRADDYERAILKFRQKNSDLNEEIQHLKDEILIFKAQEEEFKSDKSGLSLHTININRAFAEIVDSEIKAVELEYSKQHVLYIRNFLPDNFTKPGGDNDCVILCVLFPRMAAKSLLLVKLLDIKYPAVPNGIRREHVTLSHKAEQWGHVKKFSYILQGLYGILKKFEL